MNHDEVLEKLNELRSLPAENEVVEFKTAKTQFNSDDLGKYFSAISNEANLANKRQGWLVFGVENTQRKVVGTHYCQGDRAALDKMKLKVADKTTNRITFIEIYEVAHPDGRVVMFQIPAAPRGIPIAWGGHYYGRDGESLVPLNISEQERIRRQSGYEDWTAVMVPNVSVETLDPDAIAKARENYVRKNPRLAKAVAIWGAAEFLTKTKVMVGGQLTRAAVLLLGGPEAMGHLLPAQAQITWVLYNKEGIERDYQHFYPPYILAVDEVFAKIRNLRYRYMREGTLFPEEVDQYDPIDLKEALSNCIAHMDYALGYRISVAENEDGYISFANPGSFLPGSVEAVIRREEPPEFYRNPLLAATMEAYNMIDSIGRGVKNMFLTQKHKKFPLPDYDLSNQRVKTTLTGKVLDINYARVLARNPDLTLEEIMMLDKVQKKKPLKQQEAMLLKEKGLLEGRKPNYHISASLASKTGQEAVYILSKGIDDEHYKKLVEEYIRQFRRAKRADIEVMMLAKLPDVLSENQKHHKVKNLLQALKKEHRIKLDAERNWVADSPF